MQPRLAELAVGLALLLFVGSAGAVHRANSSPLAIRDAGLRQLRATRAAVGSAEAAALSAKDRVSRYHGGLEQAELLLARSLEVQPLQARTLIRLAAIRWERSLPPTEDEFAFQRKAAEAAVAMAPTDPAVRLRVAKWMLAIGRHGPAARYFSESIELDPHSAGEAVAALRAAGLDADGLIAALPNHDRLLIELQDPFLAEGRREEYWRKLSSAVATTTDPTLLDRYVAHGILLGRAESVLEELQRLGPFDDRRMAAGLALQRSRVLTLLSRHDEALTEAVHAQRSAPAEPEFIEHLGDTLLQAGKPAEAIATFGRAISLVARRASSGPLQARIYRKIGEAEELLQRPDRAFDAYRLALDHDPAESVAGHRLQAIRGEGER